MSHLPARRAYQDSSPEQLWQLNGRSMLIDVQGGEFLLDDSVIDVHPPSFASRIPKPSANAQPKLADDRTPRPARPRPSMLPITAKGIAHGPQTSRRRRISSIKDAHKTPVQPSVPLLESADNVAPDHTVVRGSRAVSSQSRTGETISPPEISSPALRDAIVAPPALPDFTSTHKRISSTTKAAIPLQQQPKSILRQIKSTNQLRPLQPLGPEEGEVQTEPPRRQSGRILGFALPEHTRPPVPFPQEPEVVYESEDAPRTVSSVPVEQPTAMEWEALSGNQSIDLRTDLEDVFVDEVPVQERSRRLSNIRLTLHPEELKVTEVLNAQEEDLITSEFLLPLPLRSSTGVPPARNVDRKMEPPIEATPEPEKRPVTQSRRSSVALPRLLSPIDLETEECPVLPREVEVGESEPRVEDQTIRPRRSSVRALQSPELIAVEKEQQQLAPVPQRASLPTSQPPSSHATIPDSLMMSKPKPSARLSVAPTRNERRKSQAPVRGKAAISRHKRTSEVPKASLRSLTQVGASRRHSQSLQKRTAPTLALDLVSHPVSQGATNPSPGITIPMTTKAFPQVVARQSTEKTTPFASQPSRGTTAHSQTTSVSAPVQEPAVISRARTSIVATSAASNISATNLSAVLRPSTEFERVPDDMFERRKRDNYLAKPVGLDLTDHSTRGRGRDAVGSTGVNMSLNHIDPNVTLSTSMPGEWVENSSVIIKRHEKSRSASHPPPSPILVKQIEPRDMAESESGDEDSEDTEVGEVLKPERMKELTLSRQPDLTIEDLESVSSSVSPVKRKPVSTLHSQSRSRSTSKPPLRAPSRPPLEIRAAPPRAASTRPPSTVRLQPRSRSGGQAEPTHSNPPHVKPASTAARVSDEGLGAKLAQFGEILLNAVSSGLSFPSANTSSEITKHPDLRVSELSPRKRASSAASQKGVRGDRGCPTTRENRGRPITRELRSKPVPQNVVPPPGILKKPRLNEAPRPAHAPKRVMLHPVARVPPKSSKSKSGTHEAVTVPSRQISKKSASKTLEHPASARPRPPSQQRSRSRSASSSNGYGTSVEMEQESDVDISIVDAYEAKMFPSRVVEPSFANIAQSSPARPRRSNSRKRTLDAEINHAEQDRSAKRMRIDNDYVSPKLHTSGPNCEPSAPVKSRNQSRGQSAQSLEREGSPVQPRARSRSNSRPRMEEIVPRGYLDQYRDEEIQDVLMEMDRGEVEEDVFGSVMENTSLRPDSTTGSCPQRKAKTSRRKPSPLLRGSKANAPKVRRNTIASKCRLTVPRSPKFSETHGQRALRGIARERERKEREKQELKKKEEEKRLRLECWQGPPLLPTLGRAVPQAIGLQSDIRAEHQKEFEEKRKLWEARSSALATSTSSQGRHPIRKEIRPVYPSAAPKLSTEARAAQRREFDEAIRQKEAELERLRAERARQLEREEAEWRKQERRRLNQNAKANPIPEWYQNAPRRGNTKA